MKVFVYGLLISWATLMAVSNQYLAMGVTAVGVGIMTGIIYAADRYYEAQVYISNNQWVDDEKDESSESNEE